MHSLYVLAIIAVLAMLIYKKESFETRGSKKMCRKNAKKSIWTKYDWTQRILGADGQWKCPLDWEDTGCDWGMGKEFENKQCRRLQEQLDENDVCNSGVSVFSETDFTSIDKYPTQIYKCAGNDNILPLADGKSGYSSIIVPAGLTATVTFEVHANSDFRFRGKTEKTYTKDFVGPIQTPFAGLMNDTAVSVRVTRTRI